MIARLDVAHEKSYVLLVAVNEQRVASLRVAGIRLFGLAFLAIQI